MKNMLSKLQNGIFSAGFDPSEIMSELNDDGIFSTVDYTVDDSAAGFGPVSALKKIQLMAQAYTSRGNSFFNSVPLKKKIDVALCDWALKDYHCASNWWYNDICIPRMVADILVFDLPYDSRYTKKLYEISRRALPKIDWSLPHGSPDVGANLIDKLITALKVGVCTGDREIIKKYVAELLNNELKVFPVSQVGIMADKSFHMHDNLLYSGSYGNVFVTGVNTILDCLNGTEFEISAAALNNYADFILDGQSFIFRGDTFDFGTAGRSLSRDGAVDSSVKSGVIEAASVLLKFPEVIRKTELAALETAAASDDYKARAKHFWTSDFTAVHRKNWYISVRGGSDRLKKTEYMNGENTKGYFLADGATEILCTGREYENIFPVWDWAKIPGTTAVQIESFPLDEFELGGSPFVGGVTDGVNAVSAVTLENTTYAQIKAKKAYFVFSDGLFALGCGINSSAGKETVTCINQTLKNGDVITNSDGTAVLHGSIGYKINYPGVIKMSDGERRGSWYEINKGQSGEIIKKRVFSLYLSHGISPENARYSYIVVPSVSELPEGFKGMTEISNNEECSAVFSEKDSALGIVFWKPGRLFAKNIDISADIPCVLLIKQGGTVFAADPSQKYKKINLTVNGANVSADLPQGDYAGSTVAVKVK